MKANGNRERETLSTRQAIFAVPLVFVLHISNSSSLNGLSALIVLRSISRSSAGPSMFPFT